MTRKYFGTDGIRGSVGESVINPEFVLKLGWAAGIVLGGKQSGKVLIGKDTRVSGYILESLLEAGLASAGVDVRLLGPMPTPAIAYLIRAFRAQAGIVISASHNPYYDNGIKFFSPHGMKLPDELEIAIEEQMDKPLKMVSASQLGKVKRYNDAPGRYIEFCKSTFGSLNSNLTGLKIILDCANGATYHVAPRIFSELDAKVTELNVDPDGFNINADCGSTSPSTLQKIVLAEKADIGIAFDGDGDRLIMVDHKGEIVDGDELLFIIAKYAFANKEIDGGIVGTIMSNIGLEKALQQLGISFVRSKIGDRYVIETLQKNGWKLGGESSGHIVHLGITTTGDGIIAALQVLAAIYHYGKSLHELKSEMHKYPQVTHNIKTNKKIDLEAKPIQDVIEHSQKILGADGRILLRPSGTEPVIRLMVEGNDHQKITNILNELKEVIEKCVNV